METLKQNLHLSHVNWKRNREYLQSLTTNEPETRCVRNSKRQKPLDGDDKTKSPMRCRKKNASAACERETKNISYRGSTLARAANEYCAVRPRSCQRPRIDPPLFILFRREKLNWIMATKKLNCASKSHDN